jgi:hypothetical protein
MLTLLRTMSSSDLRLDPPPSEMQGPRLPSATTGPAPISTLHPGVDHCPSVVADDGAVVNDVGVALGRDRGRERCYRYEIAPMR